MDKGGTEAGVKAADQSKGMFDGSSSQDCESLIVANLQLQTRLEEALEALRLSEERFDAMFRSVPAMMVITDPRFMLENASDSYAQFTGIGADRLAGADWIDLINPEDTEQVKAGVRRAIETGETWEIETRLRRADGSYRWTVARAEAQRNAAGEIERWFGSVCDINDQRTVADRQRAQLAEQQHRVRNILAIVRSVFARTVETHGGLNGASDHFRGRLDALARTHGVLLRTPQASIELDEMIWNELISHGAPQSGTVEVDGPCVCLRGKAAESLGLTIHELAVNAAKYGALSAEGGTIGVYWHVEEMPSGSQLQLKWEERGVRLIDSAPSRKGFGRELIEEALPYELGANTKLDFASGGVRCSIRLPIGPDVFVADHAAEATP